MKKRLIPVLLIDRNRRLIKTVRFGERTYIGDPFNVLRIFNAKEVDEICILDIDATSDNRKPDFGFLNELSKECFMPIAYGGGISEILDCEHLNRIGIEKYILGHQAFNEKLVLEVVSKMGSQAVLACVDIRGRGKNAQCVTKSGTTVWSRTPAEHCLALQDIGVGEIILQSVDLDGNRQGYDLEQISMISSLLDIPLIALGGAGNAHHLQQALDSGASAAASGSAFIFYGSLRAVLLTYPSALEMKELQGKYYEKQ